MGSEIGTQETEFLGSAAVLNSDKTTMLNLRTLFEKLWMGIEVSLYCFYRHRGTGELADVSNSKCNFRRQNVLTST